MENTADGILKRFETLKNERSTYESFWQDLAKYVLPRKAYVTSPRTPGEKYAYDVYDATAIQANLVLAAGLHSYLTNPASKWFALSTEDSRTMKNSDVKEWLSDTETLIYDTLNGSNFSQQIHELYLDLGTFGTGCLYEEEDPQDIVRFYSRPISEIYIAEDDRERVDTVYRKFKLTARQAFEKWGDAAGEEVKKAIEAKKYYDTFDFVHCVTPRYERDVSKSDATNMPYVSYYISYTNRKLISESGYNEFPFFVPRFNKHNDDVYGSSPAMVAYSDIKMLNEIDKTIIRAAQIAIDPPLSVPNDGYMLPIKWAPRGINYKLRASADDKIEPLLTGVNLPVGFEMEEQRRTAIKKAFFVDHFSLLAEKQNMTATEVAQRVEEKMLILAPTLGRLMSELLDPIITRTLNILIRAGRVLPPPQGLDAYKIEYTSPLARAQRMEDIKAINNTIAMIVPVAQAIPEVLDKINGDVFVDTVAGINKVPPEMIRDEDEVGELRQARAEQQQAMMQMQAAQSIAETAKTGTDAMKNVKEANGQSAKA